MAYKKWIILTNIVTNNCFGSLSNLILVHIGDNWRPRIQIAAPYDH